jgi:hypothetical protein
MTLLDSAMGVLGQGAGVPGIGLSPGELVRGALFLLGVIFLLVVPSGALRGLRSRVFVLLCLGLTGVAVGALLEPAPHHLLFDAEQLVRALLGPVLVVVLSVIFVRYGVRGKAVLSAVALYGAVAGALILLLRLTGTGLPTYGRYSDAFSGFFAAPNDTGLAMLIGLTASFYLFLRHRTPVYGAASAVTTVGLLVLGTRAGLFGVALAPTAVLLVRAPRELGPRRWFQTSLVLLVCLVGFLALNRYREIRLQTDTYQAERLSRLFSPRFNRIGLGRRALRFVAGRPLLENLLGEGATAYRRGDADARTPDGDLLAEVDWIDLVGAQGALFTIALFAFYLGFLIRDRRSRRTGDSGARTVLVIALLGYLAHGIVAGHALTSPTASGVLAPLLAYATVLTARTGLPGPGGEPEEAPPVIRAREAAA